MAKIDSLENYFKDQFQSKGIAEDLERSADFGRQVATSVFDWSKTDGGHEGWRGPFDPTYIVPTGPGLWVPTPPGFAPPARPHQGDNRSMLPNIANIASAEPPTDYSDVPGSPFYKMAEEVYTISQSLTAKDSITAKYWADLPGQGTAPALFTSVLSQLMVKEKFHLFEAAIAYAKHGIVLKDGGIVVFKTKYMYNLIRPISFIRTVMNHPDWNSVIVTPPFPEYTSAHAVNMQASAEVLKDLFGNHYQFTDRTFESLYGPRSYDNFDDYVWEGAWSRVLGGIHYRASAIEGIEQGKILGRQVNRLNFWGDDDHHH